MTGRRILYLDLVGGAAGDMLMAAMVDAGAPLDLIRSHVARLGLDDVRIDLSEGQSAGLRVKRIDVMVRGSLADGGGIEGHPRDLEMPHLHPHEHGHGGEHSHGHGGEHQHSHEHQPSHGGEHSHGHGDEHRHGHGDEHRHDHGPVRPYSVVRALLERAGLPDRVAARAQDVFRRLAEAESIAHGVPLDEVHFHEVGADDALTDIVGVATAVEALEVDEIIVSPIPLAGGLARGSHGPIPLPPPAVLHVLHGAKTYGVPLFGESVTPTGASLIASLADRYGPIPPMILERVGTGAGHREWPDRPNIVRAIVGRSDAPLLAADDMDAIVETNLDDMSPELFGDLERALFAAGAIDVWSTSAQMKKGRAGRVVSALIRRSHVEAIAGVFIEYSTSLGVRIHSVSRRRCERKTEKVSTPYGELTIKVARRAKGPPLVTPEYEDCRRRAEIHGVPLRVVYEAALEAAWRRND